jgi:hypothetical protein
VGSACQRGREALTGGTHVSAGEGEEAGTDSVRELLGRGLHLGLGRLAPWRPFSLFLFSDFLIIP